MAVAGHILMSGTMHGMSHFCLSDILNFNISEIKVKEIIVLIKARSFLDELNLEHLTS